MLIQLLNMILVVLGRIGFWIILGLDSYKILVYSGLRSDRIFVYAGFDTYMILVYSGLDSDRILV